MNMTIRGAEESDCAAITELFKEMLDFHGRQDPYFTRAQLEEFVWKGVTLTIAVRSFRADRFFSPPRTLATTKGTRAIVHATPS